MSSLHSIEWAFIRGAFRLLILAILEESVMQGYHVIKRMEQVIGERPSLSTVYTILANLERKGLIRSIQRGGECRYYVLTERGRRLLANVRRRSRDRLISIMSKILGVKNLEINASQSAVR